MGNYLLAGLVLVLGLDIGLCKVIYAEEGQQNEAKHALQNEAQDALTKGNEAAGEDGEDDEDYDDEEYESSEGRRGKFET